MRKILTIAFAATALFANAQLNVGPMDVYVSKQNPSAAPVAQGNYPGKAGEGRVINMKITDVKGPVTIDPLTYDLNGPVCPTYDSHGKRSPENPLPPTTKNFEGKILMKPADIPTPGTTVEASFMAKDHGYYTICSKSQQVPYDSVVKVLLNIISINLKLEDAEACVGDPKTTYKAKVKETYPAGKGKVTWKALNGIAKITAFSDAECSYKCDSSGDEMIVATYTVGLAKYSDTLKIKSRYVKFKKENFDLLFAEGRKLNMMEYLDKKSAQKELEFTCEPMSKAPIKLDEVNPMWDIKNQGVGGWVTNFVQIKGCPSISDAARFRWLGIRAKCNDTCDGYEASCKVEVYPQYPDLDPDVLKNEGLTGVTPKSEPKDAWGGNPSGKKELDFTAVTGANTFKIKNAYWYSSQADHCNNDGHWKIKLAGKLKDGSAVKSGEDGKFAANAGGNCVNGSAGPTQLFSGEPEFKIDSNAAKKEWQATYKAVGTFKRDVKAAITLDLSPNSQFFKETEDEEKYHVEQMEWKKGVAAKPLWIADSIIANVKKFYYGGSTKDSALALARAYFVHYVGQERMRCRPMLAVPHKVRCAVEAEAKLAIKAAYIGVMKCSYPTCP